MKLARWILPYVYVASAIAFGALAAFAGPSAREAKPFADNDSLYDAPGRTVFTPHRGGRVPFRSQLAAEEAASRARVAELSAQLATATPDEAPDLARRIEEAKRDHDARLVEIRLERARALGLGKPVSDLERRLSDLRFGRKGGR